MIAVLWHRTSKTSCADNKQRIRGGSHGINLEEVNENGNRENGTSTAQQAQQQADKNRSKVTEVFQNNFLQAK